MWYFMIANKLFLMMFTIYASFMLGVGLELAVQSATSNRYKPSLNAIAKKLLHIIHFDDIFYSDDWVLTIITTFLFFTLICYLWLPAIGLRLVLWRLGQLKKEKA